MLWLKEVEMVDSVDTLKSSRSGYGKYFPDFEMLDAKDCLGSEQDHPEFSSSKRRSVSKSRKRKKRIGSREGDKSPS